MNTKTFTIIKNESEVSQLLANNLNDSLLKLGMKVNEQEPMIVFTVGGDGTFLRAIKEYNHLLEQVKFIPINTGNIGFNIPFKYCDLERIINDLQEKKLFLQEFDALEVITPQETIYGLNEVKLVTLSKTMNFDLYLNGIALQNCQSSGFVISTKAGSTGFSKSIKGAVIISNKNLLQFQEIAAVEHRKHTSLNAPLILDDSFELVLAGNFNASHLIIDSMEHSFIGDKITVRLIPHKIKILIDSTRKLDTIKQLQKTFIF